MIIHHRRLIVCSTIYEQKDGTLLNITGLGWADGGAGAGKVAGGGPRPVIGPELAAPEVQAASTSDPYCAMLAYTSPDAS